MYVMITKSLKMLCKQKSIFIWAAGVSLLMGIVMATLLVVAYAENVSRMVEYKDNEGDNSFGVIVDVKK